MLVCILHAETPILFKERTKSVLLIAASRTNDFIDLSNLLCVVPRNCNCLLIGVKNNTHFLFLQKIKSVRQSTCIDCSYSQLYMYTYIYSRLFFIFPVFFDTYFHIFPFFCNKNKFLLININFFSH